MSPHIHTPDDGRGMRRVLLNGREVKSVFYADTKKGVVRYYLQPLRLDKWRKTILSRTARGEVRVEACDG